MFPVSGAEQLIASGAIWGLPPCDFGKWRILENIQATTAFGVGKKEIPESPASSLLLQRFKNARMVMWITGRFYLLAIYLLGRVNLGVHELE